MILKLALFGAMAYAGICLLAWVFQRHMIYFPLPDGPPPAHAFLPGAEDVRFTTEDGLELAGWFLPGAGDDGVTVLVFNGNGADRSYRTGLAARLAGRGMSVMLFDYRGYAGHPGTPSERGLRKDAAAARAYLSARPDVDPERIVYFGESLGTAMAIGLAVEHPPLALVLRSPFSSMAELGQHHMPFLPVRWLIKDRYACLKGIRQVHSPILVLAGSRDSVVPLKFSQRLYEAAPEPKRLHVIDGADHNDDALCDGPELIGEVTRFIDETKRVPGTFPGGG